MAFAVHAVLKVINLLMYIAMLHADTPTATAPPRPWYVTSYNHASE